MGIGCRNPTSVCLFSLLFILGTLALVSRAANSIAPGESIADNQTIISSDQKFELGFFSPANSTAQYVGIWYHNVQERTVIWVANRESPISGKNGSLRIGDDGNLVILEGDGRPIWSTDVSVAAQNSTAILMDSGNLVLTNGSSEGLLWQSFHHPSDTFLPNMEAHMNVRAGENRTFTSWRSADDPSPGNYTMGVDPRASPQIVIWQQNSRRWRSGHWDGLIFMGVPRMRTLASYGFRLTQEGDGRMYFTYITLNASHIVRFIVSWDGYGQQLLLNQGQMNWVLLMQQPSRYCDFYNRCGNFGLCSLEGSPMCQCLDGYRPNNEDQWSQGNWSEGCARSSLLQCERNSTGDTFSVVEWVKLPDFADGGEARNTNDCRTECLQNCSCNAYAFVDVIGCMIWTRDLVDIEKLTNSGATLYIRIADSGGKSKISKIGIIAIALSGAFIVSISIYLLWRYRMKMKARSNSPQRKDDPPMLPPSGSKEFSTECSRQDPFVIEGTEGNGPELPLFSFNSIVIATNDFANENKLGKGGFGPVHKGTLPGGQVIAVKRLSRWSGQGLEEFKNEIILIAKLQHRNLVRLLGCCIEGEEKMLIYEYMPNKSLDFFLFDPAKQAQLDWRKRFEIIKGIARGLVYLHRDSRLRIIHRDLKASNILLDEEMNPKISDFGMARIFGGNQHEANTIRVVGTYGYMAPEYAMEGLFSTKSDVYSFGVLLLEIVSGQRNSGLRSLETSNLIRHAWNLWNDGKASELIDPSIAGSSSPDEATRCVHVGMLCVQESAGNRPSMSSVVLMLESAGSTLPTPKHPSFTSMALSEDTDLIVEESDFPSSNDVTVTEVVGR